MNNDYRVASGHVVIYLDRKDGARLETKVDTVHLALLKSMNVKFFPSWDTRTKSFYVVYHTKNEDGRDTVRSLHRLITECPDHKVVDHWDKDTLNNLDSNLKIVTQSKNLQNRNSIHPRNTTGFKGVSSCRRTGKYIAQIVVNKKHIWLGRHDTPEEANKVYMEFRKNNKDRIHLNTEVL